MKKFLSCILSICILLSSIGTVTFAADSGATLAVNCVSSCEAGDTVTVTVALSGATDYAGVSCRLNYDSSLMSVVTDSAACELTGGQVTINENLANQIHISYARTTKTSAEGNLLTVQFKMNDKASGTAAFSITNAKLYDENSSSLPITAEGASMTVTYEPAMIKPQVASETVTTGDTYLVNIDVSKLSDYCGFSFRVQYDSTKFDIVSIAQTSSFSEGNFTENAEYSENEAFVSYALAQPISTSGTICTVTFTAKDNVAGDATFKVTNVKAFDENSEVIDCAAGETSVTVVCSHKGVEWQVVTPPSCTKNGTKTFTCACGYSDTDVIETTEHDYEAETVPPTESTAGYTKYTCSVCGDTYTEAGDPATGYTITYNANGGTFTVTSQNKAHDVDLVLTSEIPTRDGYNFLGWATTSTATVAEYVAGATYSENKSTTLYAVWEEVVTVVEPTIPSKMGASLTLENEVLLNVKFFLENYEGAMADYIDRVGLLMWDADKVPAEATYENCSIIVTDVVYDTTDKCLKAICPGIPAKELGDEISYRPFYRNNDGTYTYGRLKENYSPKTYCYNMLKDSDKSDDELMVSILNYGAAAQNFFSYRTDSLMNSELTDEQKVVDWNENLVRTDWSIPTEKEGEFTRDSAVITGRGASLTLVGAIDYNFKFKVSGITVKSAKVYCWTEADYNAVDVLTKESATVVAPMECTSTNAQYEYTYEGLPAKKMFSPIYSCAEITDTSGNVYYSGIYPYCPERYAYNNYKNTNSAIANIAKAIAVYGDAARKYFG